MPEEVSPNAERNRKLVRGCLAVVLGVWALILLVGVVAAVLFWQWSRTPEGREIVDRASKGVDVLQQSMSGPGAEALRATGCETAMILDGSAMVDVIAPDKAMPEGEGITAIICQTGMLATPVPCETLARTWVDFNGGLAPWPFMVQSQRSGGGQVCQQSYEPDGSLSLRQPGQAP